MRKFLQNISYKSFDYAMRCPECQSETYIKNYLPWEKPRRYTCTVCRKIICVEHEQMVNMCYCFCYQCHKQTITIPGMLIKYCLSCKQRKCDLCNMFRARPCKCACRTCGEIAFPDHDCRPRCHNCLAP